MHFQRNTFGAGRMSCRSAILQQWKYMIEYIFKDGQKEICLKQRFIQ
jgi:hypothetical protein